jgi:hypothetical protein
MLGAVTLRSAEVMQFKLGTSAKVLSAIVVLLVVLVGVNCSGSLEEDDELELKLVHIVSGFDSGNSEGLK